MDEMVVDGSATDESLRARAGGRTSDAEQFREKLLRRPFKDATGMLCDGVEI